MSYSNDWLTHWAGNPGLHFRTVQHMVGQFNTGYSAAHVTVQYMLQCSTCYSATHVTVQHMLGQCLTCHSGEHFKLQHMLGQCSTYYTAALYLGDTNFPYSVLFSVPALESRTFTIFFLYACFTVQTFTGSFFGSFSEPRTFLRFPPSLFLKVE